MLTRDEIIKKYGQPDPNKKNNFINYDAIESLPDQLDVMISEFKFDPNKLTEYFTNVGTKEKPSWYPCTDTMYKIADMCGIIGCGENTTVQWITEEIDINCILLKPFGSEPTMRIIKTGARVTKQSKVLCEDGNYRLSSPESNEFNFFTRAELDFLTEEKYTNSYTKKQDYYKYDTPIKRQLRLKELEKFAIQQAETKAFVKTIRVLAGLPTGFSSEDLKDGKLIFHKFVKSKKAQQIEFAARIEAMRNGRTSEITDMSSQLFGTNQIEAPITEPYEPDTTEPEPEKKNPFENKSPFGKPVDEKEKIKIIIQKYISKDKENKNYQILKNTVGALEYLEKMLKEYDSVKLEKAKDTLLGIENHIPGIIKIDHDIDLGKDVF